METIQAKEGMWLTQFAETDVVSRVYSKELFLAVNDSAENWRDAADEEYQTWLAECERLAEEHENRNAAAD